MMKRIALSCLLFLGATGAFADQLTFIVDRERDGISLYVSAPATAWPEISGTDLTPLLEQDGTIDVARLYDGTFDQADSVFAPIDVNVNGTVGEYDGLSLMVHDPEVLPAFLTPYHGDLAISVCTSPETVEHLGLNTLMSYAGYYFWKVDPTSELSFDFPQTGRDAITVQVLDYYFGRLTDQSLLTVEDGATLAIAANSGRQGTGLLVPLGVGAVALLALLAALLWRGRPKPAES